MLPVRTRPLGRKVRTIHNFASDRSSFGPKHYVPIFNSEEWELHVQTGPLRARERQAAMAAKAAKACRRRLAAAWKRARADIAYMRAWAEASDADAMPLSS